MKKETISKILLGMSTALLILLVASVMFSCKPEIDPKTGRPVAEGYAVQPDTVLGKGNSMNFFKFKQSGMKYMVVKYGESLTTTNLTVDSLQAVTLKKALANMPQ